MSVGDLKLQKQESLFHKNALNPIKKKIGKQEKITSNAKQNKFFWSGADL